MEDFSIHTEYKHDGISYSEQLRTVSKVVALTTTIEKPTAPTIIT